MAGEACARTIAGANKSRRSKRGKVRAQSHSNAILAVELCAGVRIGNPSELGTDVIPQKQPVPYSQPSSTAETRGLI
jgi:hypothetical protein